MIGQETSFKSFSVREGLAQSQVFSITQDNQGYLWMATQGGGLCKFDGKEFFTITISEGLLSNTVNALSSSGDTIFAGSNNGLSILSSKRNSVIRSIPLSEPVRILKKIQKQLYVVTDQHIYTFVGDSLQRITEEIDLKNFIPEDLFLMDTRLILSTNKGMVSISDLSDKILPEKIETKHITKVVSYQGKLLMGSYGKGILVFNKSGNGYDLVKDTLEMFQDLIITEIFVDRRINLWIGTQRKGVYRYDANDKKWEHFGENEGLSNDHVKCIFEDNWNQIWIGTSGGGVNQYSGSQFLHYTENSGLNGDYIYSVLKSKVGELWVATSGGGVMRINDTMNYVYNGKTGFHDVKVKALFESKNQLIWIGTEGKGMSVYFRRSESKDLKREIFVQSFDTILNFDSGKLFPSTLWVNCFAEDKNGEIYISTLGDGLIKAKVMLDTFPRIFFNKLKVRGRGEISQRINHMFFNSKGDLILATNDKGIGILSKGELTYLNIENSTVPNKITSIEEGANGELWFASEKGLGCIIEDSVVFYRKISGLSSNNIYQIQSDHLGYVWVGTEKGVDRLKLLPSKDLEVKHFGAEEGFTGIETSLNASFLDSENNLWFGTVNGLSVYQPKKIEKTNAPPVVFFNSIKLFYDTLFSETSDLEYHQNSLSFSFGSVFLPAPDKVKYQWKLKGFDSEWSEPSDNSSITYSNLRPGSYVFYVRAGVGEDWSEPIQFSFAIKKPYWEESWFLIMVWGGGLVVLIGVVLLFVNRSRKRGRELRDKLEMEKSLIELEQKALRLQMNPHFIFNSLNTIQHLIIEKDEKSAKYYLSKFAKLMRQILENSRERLISISDEIKTLENYLIIEKFSRQDFEYEIVVEEGVDLDEDILPPMMIQPFVENAIIHGLKGLKERKGKIKISFISGDGYIQFEVEDNGQGRENAEKQKSQIANYHRSTALSVTQERLDNMNKGQNFKSFEIVDLKDELGNPMGTKIIIRVQH
ncbi:MAG: histidine kinase [Crocinitomicaceae bacterium]|nr:histidine kinase [Crocinitomicaceae bacterium]